MDNSTSEMDESREELVRVDHADLTDAVRACALLADLTVNVWSGESTDRTLGEKIRVDAGAVGNTGRYIKNLMAGCDSQLKETRSAYAHARQVHTDLTLPWVSNPGLARAVGPRLLPNLLFEQYLKTMGAVKRTAQAQLRRFLDEYPALVPQAQANLGGLAKLTDYPPASAIEQRFSLSFDFAPIPDTNAFQGLPDAMLERLGAQLHKRQQAAVGASQAAMWGRVRDAVGHLVERLEDPEKVFKVNTVDNVRELIVLLPGFNCAGDPRVGTIVSDIEQMLQGIDAKQLRDNVSVRADVAGRAKSINDKLAQWGL